jgi:acetyltransferase-like isoleucine patch superfamily enzyme
MSNFLSISTRLKSRFYYPLVFASFGKASRLFRPTALVNPRYIHIGNKVHIGPGVRIEAIVIDPANPPEIRIGDNVNIEQNVHIICHRSIVIESDVSITGFCTIVDTTHPIDNLRPDQKMGALIEPDNATVEIGCGAFIGMGARILPGVRIGTGAVIGANAVVTKSVPDFAVAAGVPCQVFRQRRMVE